MTTATITKIPNPANVDEPGGPVEFSVLVTNTGNVRLLLDSLTDTEFGDITQPGQPADRGHDVCVARGRDPRRRQFFMRLHGDRLWGMPGRLT